MRHSVEANTLGKRFRVYGPDRPWTIQDLLMRGPRHARPSREFWGLRNVTFSIEQGQMLGIIGRNGAGKSTLLRLVGKLLRADEGSVTTHGRISGILELGAGFHGDLSGLENIYIAGIVGGLTRQEVRAHIESIVEFSELEAYIDRPLRGYSTGMQMRLAFSVAIHVSPDILLVDEVLSVGDFAFQKKCLAKILEFKRRDCTIVVVSHDLNTVRELCDVCLWLDNGRVRCFGGAGEVVDMYLNGAVMMETAASHSAH